MSAVESGGDGDGGGWFSRAVNWVKGKLGIEPEYKPVPKEDFGFDLEMEEVVINANKSVNNSGTNGEAISCNPLNKPSGRIDWSIFGIIWEYFDRQS
ncbi:hypothetical protein CHU92_06255 [Flavobacterium cyanobacteriorum]|uniref:Uncharacterized protein n=1 Tax=Flavobacterium cyanobacteriorum TaxID=2022802 RepID=A0A255ZC35_9FLAO|nr:hypothetical protein [Flavobacterium cyanobacteriorum]OYQ38170.1 hypothetical protein CHU92_06255 [Flavobacterium cyanobacteriorum]